MFRRISSSASTDGDPLPYQGIYSPPPRALLIAAAVAAPSLALVAAITLGFPGSDVAITVSSVALVTVGILAILSCAIRAKRSRGRRRRGWALIGLAGFIVVGGNVFSSTLSGGFAEGLAANLTDITVSIGLIISIVALLHFTRTLTRRTLLGLVLDGTVAGAAVLIIASALIYDPLLEQAEDGFVSTFAVLAIPVLDVMVATIAGLQALRAGRADRVPLSLIAVGYLAYMGTDLTYVVAQSESSYTFGTWTDLGWIAGYAFIGLGAWAPSSGAGRRLLRRRGAQAVGTIIIFAILLAAGLIQTVAGGGPTTVGRVALWVVLVLAAAARELLHSQEIHDLRQGLEARVAAQTADLRRWGEQTQALLNSVGDGIYGVDVTGRITFMNRSAQEMLQLDDTALGKVAHDLFHAPMSNGQAYPIASCYVTEAVEQAAVSNAEEDTYLRADQTELAVEITAAPVVSEDGADVSGAVVVFRDATERREVEAMKDHFLSVVSHELRTPLTAIRGSLGLISSGALGDLPEEVSALTATAEESAERLGRLVNDIVDVERLASGSFVVDLGVHRAADLVSGSLTELRSFASAAGIDLVAEDIEGTVFADADRFSQVLTNLVGNAVKFSEPGTAITLSAVPNGDEVVFSVADQGRGIPPERIEDIFERFRQVDSSDARRQSGTGLGLAITRAIITQLGGRVWAESVVGEGSTFRFTLQSAAHAGADGECDCDGACRPAEA